jgi:DNA-binding Lrp family transcriptional regulator
MTYYYDSQVAIMVRFDLQPYVEAAGSGLAEHRELGTCAPAANPWRCRAALRHHCKLPSVQELHSVAGEYDLLAKVRTPHARDLEAVLLRLRTDKRPVNL